MSNYTKTTDFEAKDSLPTGDAEKIIRGADFETEFDNIATAIATKADTAGPTFTGTLTFETISDGTIAVSAFVDEDDMSSNSATLVPTQQSVKAYVDAQTTAQDLDFQADTGGALSIDLDSETMTFTGGTGIDTSGALNTVTFAIDSTVATLTGTQTLTNKTLTAPTISGNLTTDGTIDGRDVATDGAKLDGIEAGATGDQTNAEIRAAVEAATDSNVFTDADHSKLDGIEALADVTDTANVTAAGALMDSELTSEASVKALDQGVATTDSPTFAGLDVGGTIEFDGLSGTGAVSVTNILDEDNMASDSATALATQQSIKAYVDSTVAATNELVEDTTPQLGGDLDTNGNDILFADNDKAIFGAGSDLQIYHDGSNSFITETGTGYLGIGTNGSKVIINKSPFENMAEFITDGAVNLYHNNSQKFATTSTGIDVTGTIVGDGLDLTVGTNDRTLLREFNSSNNLSSVNADNSAFRPFEIAALGTTISYGGTDTLVTGNNTVNFYLNSGSISHGFQYNENGGELALYDDTGTAATLFDQSNNNTRLLELIDGSNIQIGLGGSNTTGALIFTKASGAEFGRITGSGYFGLNNDNPDTTLHIGNIGATNATAQGRIKIEDTSGSLASEGGLEFVTSAFGSGYGWKVNSVDSTGVHLDFGTRQNSTTWSDKVRFMWDGRVVIGDTTTNNNANFLKVKGTQADSRIAMSTNGTSGQATVEAQVENYWSGTTYTGTGIVQYDSAATGTTAGLSNANLGALRFQNGSNALIYTNGSTSINFGTVGTRRMTLDTSGNLVIGDSTAKTRLQVSGAGAANAPSLGSVSSNVPLYLTNADTAYGLIAGTNNATGHAWLQAQRTDGTAQAYSITLNEAGGNVGIGSSSFDSKLHVEGGSLGTTAGDSLRIFESSFASGNTDKLEFLARRLSDGTDWQTASQSIQRKVDATLMGYVRFGNNGSEPVSFGNGTTEYARFDAAGNLLVGKPAIGSTTDGFEARASGYTALSDTSGAALNVNRNSTDGNLVTFTKDGTNVGSIGVDSGDNFYVSASAANHAGLYFSDVGIAAMQAGSLVDAAVNLGSSSYRFKDLYLSGTGFVERISTDHDGDWGMEMSGVSTARIRFNSSAGGSTTVGSITVSTTSTAYNQSSDERLKENIVDAPSASDDIDALQVRSFDWKINGEHQKYGMVAQELNTVAPEAVTIPDDPEEMAGVDYSKLVPMLVKEIQSLRARVAQLEGAN